MSAYWPKRRCAAVFEYSNRRGPEGPSIMMQAKTERPQRGGRDGHDDEMMAQTATKY